MYFHMETSRSCIIPINLTLINHVFAIIALSLLSCNAYKKPGDYFDSISHNDIRLGEPQPGEWRLYHNEAHQSFAGYQELNPKKAELGKTKIYLVALGNFSRIQTSLLELTREYLEIFFQLKTEFLPPLSDQTIPNNAKRVIGYSNAVQLYTPYILDKLLKGKIPQDGYALMAVSEKDLYPGDDWNFVFGIASYADRVGVSSIARYQGNGLDSSNFTLCLKRLIATASHEIGHMFSIQHCTHAKCAMNGSNSLPESDGQPLRLCSECQRKLNWNIGYDNKKRLKELAVYFRRNNLLEDLHDLEKDENGLK